jgi:hypothetical protein
MVAIPQAPIGRQLTFRERGLNQELDRLYATLQQKQFDEKNVDIRSLTNAIARVRAVYRDLIAEQLTMRSPKANIVFDHNYVGGQAVQCKLQWGTESAAPYFYRDDATDWITLENADLYVKNNDIIAAGGFRQSIDGWYKTGLAVPTSATIMERFLSSGGDAGLRNITMVRDGSVTGVALRRTDGDLTTGQITVEVYIDGAQTGLAATLNPTGRVATARQSKDLDGFTAGEHIAVYVTVAAGTNGSPDVRATLEIET